MSVLVKPLEQIELRGVYTAGNPATRPRNTAEICDDFRVMPGNFLRLRSGRAAQYKVANGTIMNIRPFRSPDFQGSNQQLCQASFNTGPAWHWFNLMNYVIAPAGLMGATEVEKIATQYDGSFAVGNVAASTNLNDRPVFYNGLGVRDMQSSRPALSTYISGYGTRYFGLDCWAPAGTPTATHVPGSGGNQCQTSLTVYTGLWHRPSDHYSNGLLIGTFPDPLVPGTITVSGLHFLTYASHNAQETSELFRVFYATIDGGQVPYLILNATLDGPYAVPVTQDSAALSLDTTTDNGWNLDLTKQMQRENFPPRPMRSISYVGGRLYGVLNTGGIGDMGGREFTYIPLPRDMTAVCWSAAAGDALSTDFLGDPLQAWPLSNLAYTPSGDQPLVVAPSVDETAVLVITPTSTFLLQEQADGLHEWTTVSRIHGIGKPQTLRVTRYGIVWVDQRNQIVMLPPGSLQIQVLSIGYQNLLKGNVRCADYILDPDQLNDRYQVWLDTQRVVCHDFLLDSPGNAYTQSNQDFNAAASAVDGLGRTHHIIAKDALYTHESQPFVLGGIIARDDTFEPDGTINSSEIIGTYVRNWDDFGDADIRKEMPRVDLIGDGAPAPVLGNSSPLSVQWYADFEQVIFTNTKTAAGARISQSLTNAQFRYQLVNSNKFWYKLWFRLQGHSADYGTQYTLYPELASEGNNARNFSACILRVLWRLGPSENRP